MQDGNYSWPVVLYRAPAGGHVADLHTRMCANFGALFQKWVADLKAQRHHQVYEPTFKAILTIYSKEMRNVSERITDTLKALQHACNCAEDVWTKFKADLKNLQDRICMYNRPQTRVVFCP